MLDQDVIRNVGINHTVIMTDIEPDLIHQIPLLLRVLNMTGHPVLVAPDPFSPPNRKGMLLRTWTVNVSIYFFNETTILVSMDPIRDFSVSAWEDFTVSVPFADIEYCNGSDPNPKSLGVPKLLPLISASVFGQSIMSQGLVGTGFVVLSALGVLSGSPEGASAAQTLAAIGLLSCSSPTTRAAVGNKRALGPLPLGSDYIDVISGNFLLVGGFFVLQVAAAAVLYRRGGPDATLVSACAASRFPAVTITAYLALFQGTVFAAGSATTAIDADVLHLGVGVTGAAVTFSSAAIFAYCSYRHIRRSFYTYDGAGDALAALRFGGRWMRVLAPVGYFEPRTVGHRFGPIIGSRLQRPFVWPVLGLMPPVILGAASFVHPSSDEGCIELLSTVATLFLAISMTWVLVQPHRVPCMNIFSSVSVALSALLLYLQLWNIVFPDSEVLWTTLVIAVLQMALQLIRMVVTGLGVFFDRKLLECTSTTYKWTLPAIDAKEAVPTLASLRPVHEANDGIAERGIEAEVPLLEVPWNRMDDASSSDEELQSLTDLERHYLRIDGPGLNDEAAVLSNVSDLLRMEHLLGPSARMGEGPSRDGSSSSSTSTSSSDSNSTSSVGIEQTGPVQLEPDESLFSQVKKRSNLVLNTVKSTLHDTLARLLNGMQSVDEKIAEASAIKQPRARPKRRLAKIRQRLLHAFDSH